MTIRVRFAPSPTGFLHLGGLRTALYNFLFAKQNGGHFVLRIEDTDRKRLVPQASEKLEATLSQLGLPPDESPGTGGPAGPYFQSERLALYKDSLGSLLKEEKAYPCFCSESRLDLLRKDALRRRQVPKYDNRCRSLPRKLVEEKLRQGAPHCYRFTLGSSDSGFTDIVYGKYSYDPAANEGDPVVVKEDGFPTYHFANVVDDHHMGISHVLRGEEWLVSTPKHLLMYKAFGWTPPQFAHLPLILNKDGTKLSKRQDDLRVESILSRGYYPLSILNFVTKIGGGFDEKMDGLVLIDDLISKFNLSRINAHSCRLDTARLNDMNAQEIRRRLSISSDKSNMVNELREKVRFSVSDRHAETTLQDRVTSEAYLQRVLEWASGASRLVTLNDLVSPDFDYLWLPPSGPSAPKQEDLSLSREQSSKILEVVSSVPTEEFLRNVVTTKIREICSANGLKFALVMKVLRSNLSNLKEGPSVGEMMEVLGKEETLSRLNSTLN